jgi:tetratricopeptide (TPR) repeat protein
MQAPSPNKREHSPEPPRRPGMLAPVVILGLFAFLLPVRLTSQRATVSSDACLSLGDRPLDTAGEHRAAIEECSALYRDDVELLAAAGAAYEPTDRARAETIYRRVLQLDPGYAEIHLRLGRLLLARHAAAGAAREAEAGLAIQPNRRAFLELSSDARAFQAEQR